MLYIVGTPIGNLADVSLRALEVLKKVDLIACEDTRRSKILLRHYNITTPTTSFYQHNRLIKADYLLGLLKEGKDVALVSDAGLPGILDPGYNLINLAIKENISLTVIPGPSAFLLALVASGKPTHRFIFAGFLPKARQRRINQLRKLKEMDCTVVFYESVYRIVCTLEDIVEVWGKEQVVCVARELTKKFEEVIRKDALSLCEYFKQHKAKGEFVVVI